MLLELSGLSRRSWVQILPLQPTQAKNLTSKPMFLAWTGMSTCSVRYQSLDQLTTGLLGCQYLEPCMCSESAELGRSTSDLYSCRTGSKFGRDTDYSQVFVLFHSLSRSLPEILKERNNVSFPFLSNTQYG